MSVNFSRLGAVNRILSSAREHTVSSLPDTTVNDSLAAEQKLDEVNLREQQDGLHCNTTIAEFTRDDDGTVKLPSNTLFVTGARSHVHREFFHKEVDGEMLLFDGGEDPATSDFTAEGANLETVNLRVMQLLDFTALPSTIQFSIVDQAAVEYQEENLGDKDLGKSLKERAGRSRAMARAFDMRSRPHNQVRHGNDGGPRRLRSVPRGWYS